MMLDESSPLITVWRMGKVTATYPGTDGKVRAADVQVSTTSFPDYYYKTLRKLDPKDVQSKKAIHRRPIVKLAPLMSWSTRSGTV